MTKLDPTMAEQVANAVSVFQTQQTGHSPKAVRVALNDDTLVVTLHDALTPVEKSLSRKPEGAVQVQEYHRQIFNCSVGLLRQEIKRITGIAVVEAAAEVETAVGATILTLPSGTMVQVFKLAGRISLDVWNGTGSGPTSHATEDSPC